MKILKKFTSNDGRIVRIAKVRDNEKLSRTNMIVRVCDIEYINKTIDDDIIKKFYFGYVNSVNKLNKIRKGKLLELVSYDKYKKLMINDYMLRGIEYKNNNKLKLLETENHK